MDPLKPMAYVARDRLRAGAAGYINAAVANTPGARQQIEAWLDRGWLIERVPLETALKDLALYSNAPSGPSFVSIGAEPIKMLRRQAD
jgi:hypothetical protein